MRMSNLAKYAEDIERCVRCSFCQVDCPVYTHLRWVSKGPKGRIQLLKGISQGEVEVNDFVIDSLFKCSLCKYCTTKCPSGIEISEILEAARRDLSEQEYSLNEHRALRDAIHEFNNPYREDQKKRKAFLIKGSK